MSASSDVRTVTFLGDVYVPQGLPSRWVPPSHYICNLEAPVTLHGVGTNGKVNLRAEGWHLDRALGCDPLAVCLANNHMFDYGDRGYTDTIRCLSERGVRWFGAGSLEDAPHTATVTVGGCPIVLLGFVCRSTHPSVGRDFGPDVLDAGAACRAIESAKSADGARVVVCLHWGEEEVGLPKASDRRLAQALADAGADLILGHHSHCVQAMETHKGVPIYYGLGNCLMPDLRVPVAFDESGSAQEFYVKRQMPWNRRSLALVWEPRSTEIRRIGLMNQAKGLVETKARVREISMDASDAGFGACYGRARRRAHLAVAFAKWAHSPSLPTVGKVRSLGRMIGGGRGGAA